MRLAIVASHPIQYQAPLFRELARRLDVTVFFAHRANKSDQAEAGFGVDFDWDVDLLSGYRQKFLENVSRRPGLEHFTGCDTPSIRQELLHGQFDGLLVMGWHLKCYLQAIWAAKRTGIPVMARGDSQLATPRSALKRIGKSIVYPLALGVFDAALYVGVRSRAYWRRYGYPDDRLFFSPHCVDNDWFAERATFDARQELRARHGISAETDVALFAGKLMRIKHPLDLIAAAALLRAQQRQIAVMVAGSGRLSEEMSSKAAAENIQIVQLGFCNQTHMPAAYAAADLLVLPSEQETWGLVANEALACGRPIVVSDACGCGPDLAEDGVVGRVFRAGDIQSLARAIMDLADRPPTKAAIARRAAQYGPHTAADGIQDALEAIASMRSVA